MVKFTQRLPALCVVAFVVAGAAVVASKFFSPTKDVYVVSVKVPRLSQVALSGKAGFDKNCAQCHGANGAGSDKGPPLVHDIYNPGHHSDGAFFSAAKRGVRRHHWSFENMPPQPEVTDREIAAIVRYVRELQEANGIFWKPHRM